MAFRCLKARKETKQQKRTTLRQKAQSDGKGLREAWVDATSIDKRLREILPQLNVFADTATHTLRDSAVGHASVRTSRRASGRQIARISSSGSTA